MDSLRKEIKPFSAHASYRHDCAIYSTHVLNSLKAGRLLWPIHIKKLRVFPKFSCFFQITYFKKNISLWGNFYFGVIGYPVVVDVVKPIYSIWSRVAYTWRTREVSLFRVKPWTNGVASRRKSKTWGFLRLRLAMACVHLRWLAMTCAHFGRDQICTQVKASFSSFGHPTGQVNASWLTSINLLLANEIEDSMP